MVSFTTIVLALASAAVSLAAPVEEQLVSHNPNFILGLENGLAKRQSYVQDYTTGGGSVNFSPSSTGPFTVSFSGASDFVVGKGWNPGSTR